MFCVSTQLLCAQDSLEVKMIWANEMVTEMRLTKADLNAKLGVLIDSLHVTHHLEAGVDSLVFSGKDARVYMYLSLIHI